MVPAVPTPASGPHAPEPIAQPAPIAPAATAPLASKGILRINTRPWSRVQVDGKLVGTTPQVGIVLEAGSHTVTLTNPEFGLERVITVQVAAGQTLTKSVDLTEATPAP